MRQFRVDPRAPVALTQLSARECDVLIGVSQGRPNKEIAAQLGITEHTVKAHVGRFLERLGMGNRVDLARWAILNPGVLAGIAVSSVSHAAGCPCDHPYCATMRQLRQDAA
ncbi:MAG: response regulator transcription factor [Bryobacteraceae bacterium]